MPAERLSELPEHLSTLTLPSGRIAVGADETARGENLRHTLLVVGKPNDARALARSLLELADKAELQASE